MTAFVCSSNNTGNTMMVDPPRLAEGWWKYWRKIRRHVGEENALLLERALADKSFARKNVSKARPGLPVSIARQQLQYALAFVRREVVDRALMRVDQRRQFGQQHLADGPEFALPCSMPVNFAMLVFSQSCSRFLSVVSRRFDIIVLMLSFNSATSPRVSTWIERVRSPLVTAVATLGDGADLIGEIGGQQVDVASEIPSQVPAAPGTFAWHAEAGIVDADFARDVRDLIGEGGERCVGHVVDGVGERRPPSPFACHRETLASSFRWRRRVTTLTMPRTCSVMVGGHEIHVVSEILPGAARRRRPAPDRRAAFRANFARHARHFGGEAVELIDHRVDGVLQLEDFALPSTVICAGSSRLRATAVVDVGDVANLRSQIGAHGVDGVGEVLPRSATPGTTACTPSRPSVPTSRATRVTSEARTSGAARPSCLMVSFSCRISPSTSTVIFSRGRRWPRRWSPSAIFRKPVQ